MIQIPSLPNSIINTSQIQFPATKSDFNKMTMSKSIQFWCVFNLNHPFLMFFQFKSPIFDAFNLNHPFWCFFNLNHPFFILILLKDQKCHFECWLNDRKSSNQLKMLKSIKNVEIGFGRQILIKKVDEMTIQFDSSQNLILGWSNRRCLLVF